MFPGLKKLTYEERIDCLDLWTLEERRNRADLLHMFKMYKGLSSTPFSRFFNISSITNTRGHSAKLVKARCQMDIRRFFFCERVIDRCNCLNQETIDSGTDNTFKSNLDIRKTRMQRWVKYSIVQVQVQVPLPYNAVQVQVRKLEFKKFCILRRLF